LQDARHGPAIRVASEKVGTIAQAITCFILMDRSGHAASTSLQAAELTRVSSVARKLQEPR
jgi:hypothetical protein